MNKNYTDKSKPLEILSLNKTKIIETPMVLKTITILNKFKDSTFNMATKNKP